MTSRWNRWLENTFGTTTKKGTPTLPPRILGYQEGRISGLSEKQRTIDQLHEEFNRLEKELEEAKKQIELIRVLVNWSETVGTHHEIYGESDGLGLLTSWEIKKIIE
jgi:hypothetical protein